MKQENFSDLNKTRSSLLLPVFSLSTGKEKSLSNTEVYPIVWVTESYLLLLKQQNTQMLVPIDQLSKDLCTT